MIFILFYRERNDDIVKFKVLNTNLYNVNKEKISFIQFLVDFTKFDKNIYNKEFIIDKVDKTIFYNTNIFTLIKFIDREFIKFNKGLYCQSCYQLENICVCNDKQFKKNNYINNESEEDILDLDLNEDTDSKSGKIIVNYFVDEKDNYNSKQESFNNNNSEIIYIKKKPKINLIGCKNYNNK